jgi:hypothetical protein
VTSFPCNYASWPALKGRWTHRDNMNICDRIYSKKLRWVHFVRGAGSDQKRSGSGSRNTAGQKRLTTNPKTNFFPLPYIVHNCGAGAKHEASPFCWSRNHHKAPAPTVTVLLRRDKIKKRKIKCNT